MAPKGILEDPESVPAGTLARGAERILRNSARKL